MIYWGGGGVDSRWRETLSQLTQFVYLPVSCRLSQLVMGTASNSAERALAWGASISWIEPHHLHSVNNCFTRPIQCTPTICQKVHIFLLYYYLFLIFPAEQGLTGYRFLPFLTHGMNTIYIVLNLLVTGIPVRVLHFWQPLTFGLVYGVFSLVYTLSGATNDKDEPFIYAILDWNKSPGLTTGILLGAAFAAVLVHLLLYGLHRVKLILLKLCGRRESLVSPCEQ